MSALIPLQLVRSRAYPCVYRPMNYQVLTSKARSHHSPYTRRAVTQTTSSRAFSSALRHPSSQGGSNTHVRWYTGGSKGRGGASGGGRKGFFQNFIENLRKGVNQNRDMQESLKGFHEEREKLQQSHVVQQAKEKAMEATNKVLEYGAKSVDMTKQSYSQMKKSTAKAVKAAAETELGKKGQDIGSQIAQSAQRTAEMVGRQAEELVKTDVGQSVQKGAEIVREDLLDDIVKESGPYQSPERIGTRTEMASSYSPSAPTQENTISPNDEIKDMTVTRQSKWRETWVKIKENNPISNTIYTLKMKYDESDNLIIRASRAVTDRLGNTLGSVSSQSDMAEALAEIHKIDPSFTREDFTRQCQFEIIPTVLEAFLQGNTSVLQDWCYEPAYNVLAAILKQRNEPRVRTESKVLEVREVDVVMAKMLEQGPVLVLTFQAQQLTRNITSEGSVEDDILENVYYVWALCRDQTVYNPRTAWRVLEFGIQSSSRMLV